MDPGDVRAVRVRAPAEAEVIWLMPTADPAALALARSAQQGLVVLAGPASDLRALGVTLDTAGSDPVDLVGAPQQGV